MEVYLQKNVASRKTRKCVQKLNKNPKLKQKNADNEMKNIDFEERRSNSVSTLDYIKFEKKCTNFSSPTILEDFDDDYLIEDITINDPKISHYELPRSVNILDLKSEITNPKRVQNKYKLTTLPEPEESEKSEQFEESEESQESQESEESQESVEETIFDIIKSDDQDISISFISIVFDTTKEMANESCKLGSKTSKSVSALCHTKFEEKCTNFSSPTILEDFADDCLIEDNALNDSKILHYELSRGQKSLDFNATKKIANKSCKPRRGKSIKILNRQELYKTRVRKPSNILEHVCTKCRFESYNEPRFKKPLAVIDLDLIIYYFDPYQINYEIPSSRPLLNYFLASLYDHYDLAFWTNTPMEVLLLKLFSLRIMTNEHAYRICFCLDETSMINSYIPRLGNPLVRTMEVIRNFYSQYNETNTIFIGDQRHKFYFNNKFVMQVKKCKQIAFIKDPDLIKLTEYLILIAKFAKDLSKAYGVRITSANFHINRYLHNY